MACARHTSDGDVSREARTFKTTTADRMALSAWLSAQGCTPIVMEATGVSWKPVWPILSDGEFELALANAAPVQNAPGRKTDGNDAARLADLMAHGLIRGSFAPEEQTLGDAQSPADAQAIRARAQQPYPASPERRWRTPPSSSIRSSPTSSAGPAGGGSRP